MRRIVAIIAFAILAIGGVAVVKWPRESVADIGVPRVAGAGPAAATPSPTDDDEPSKEDCLTAVEKARALANVLPADHPSRYIAERHLHQSLAEAGNGEFDDCLYWAEHATEEVRELRHDNEKIKVMQADELPAATETADKVAEKKPARKKPRH